MYTDFYPSISYNGNASGVYKIDVIEVDIFIIFLMNVLIRLLNLQKIRIKIQKIF